jgi:environmental stress-induced protein Ves
VVLTLRAADRAAVPWKNGGGVTREVARCPAHSDLTTFDWRVSIAEVRSSGPFSAFPGVDRRMAVLAGRLSLSIEGREVIAVCPDTPPVFFPGDVAASAEPVGAAVTDLNVMTRRGSFESRLSRRLPPGPASLTLRAQTTLILALSPLALRCQAGRADLAQLDAALLERAQECEVLPHDSHGAFYLVELLGCPPAASVW